MPALQEPISPQPVNFDETEAPWYFRDDPITHEAARATVMQAFEFYQSRRLPQENRWTLADSLYNGVVDVRNWDGTQTPRSHLPNNIAFDHVEGAYAIINSALFDNPEWFSVEAMERASPADARKAQAILQHYLSVPDDETNMEPVMAIKQSIRSVLMYGTGFLELGWKENWPTASFVDPRNVYVDPKTVGCIPGLARNLIVAWHPSVEELRTIAKADSRIKLPPMAVLHSLGRNMPYTNADMGKSWASMARGVSYFPPSDDWQPLPKLRALEVLKYYEKHRVIWVLNRIYPIFEEENPYHFIPVVAAPCRDTHASFYGIGLPEAIRYPQRYAEALRNIHIDEMHLAINPMKIGGPDVGLNHGDLHTRPGLMYRTNKPKEVQVINPPGVTMNVAGEIQSIEDMADKRNGISNISIGGQGKAGQYRTAAGVQAQSQGTSVRLKQIAENIEGYMLKPLLYGFMKLIRFHTRPDDVLIGSYPDQSGGPPQLEPITAEVMHKPLRMVVQCASKMLTRDRLLAIIQPMGQALINGPVIQGLGEQGKKLNFEVWAQMCQDAGGLPKLYPLVGDMTDEEKQMRNQPPPQVVAAQQKAQQDAQLRTQATQAKFQADREKNQTALQIAQMKSQPNPFEQQTKQQEGFMKLQETQAKVQAQQEMAAIKVQAQREKAQMDRQKQESDMNMKQYEMALKAREMEQNQQMQMRQNMQNMQMDQVARAQQRQEMVRDAQVREQTRPPQRPTSGRSERG